MGQHQPVQYLHHKKTPQQQQWADVTLPYNLVVKNITERRPELQYLDGALSKDVTPFCQKQPAEVRQASHQDPPGRLSLEGKSSW